MEKFWAVILIFVVVAAAGLMYVNQVYNPQKDSQIAMADTANQTLSAVKSDVEDTAPTTVNAANVIQTVNMYCKTGNTVTISVGATDYISSSDDITTRVGDLKNYFTKVVEKDPGTGVIESIKFTKIDTE
jgi:hypothetical protein